jgi:hypothetical protein
MSSCAFELKYFPPGADAKNALTRELIGGNAANQTARLRKRQREISPKFPRDLRRKEPAQGTTVLQAISPRAA